MYKIIYENKIIDVVKYPKFVRFLASGHIAMTDKTSAQGIVGSDDTTIYSFLPITGKTYLVVTIDSITEEEFKRLQNLLNSDQEVSADESALEKAKKAKIKLMSTLCKDKIVAGFSLELSDGNSHHFKLTTEDQLNLMMIENLLAEGETYFIYHATDKPCQIYSREDMLKVIKAFKAHTLYHTTYFNAAKQYIKSLTDIEKVNVFKYGTDVSGSVENIILKQIIKNGDVC